MNSEFLRNVTSTPEADVQARPTPFEFEMAYQARVATDRIRFAFGACERFAGDLAQLREAGLQLLDALDRLQDVERRFQIRSKASNCAGREGRGMQTELNGEQKV
jgi:hypothetical protein